MKQTAIDILTKLKEITTLQYVVMWNNQFNQIEDGDVESFPFPCAMLELQPQQYNQLGGGYQQTDVDFRIHIGHVQFDSLDGNMEQNLSVFDLRNEVVQKLSLYKPSMSGELFKVSEEQDYEHTSIYHYVITFRSCVIDKIASTLIEPTLVDPIDLSLEVFFVYPQFNFDFNDDFANEYLEIDIDKREIII